MLLNLKNWQLATTTGFIWRSHTVPLGVGHLLAGENAAAETRLRQALGLFTKLGTRWQIGRTLFELGELNLTHSPTKAREYYSQALGSFEEIQAAPNVERTRLALSSLE